jgi:hypothetical protein
VTGIDITNGIPRVPRKFRRKLKQDVYFVWSAGLSTHMARERLFEPNYIAQLRGRLEFWRSVEPNDRQMHILDERIAQLEAIYL